MIAWPRGEKILVGLRIAHHSQSELESLSEEGPLDMETKSTDSRGRISLPKAFANARVIIDQISDTELRIRKAEVILEADVRFREESTAALSDRDRDRFLDLLDNPPVANPALKRAAE